MGSNPARGAIFITNFIARSQIGPILRALPQTYKDIMKKSLLASVTLASATVIAQVSPTTPDQKTAYALGADVARSMIANGIKPDPEMFALGFKDSLDDSMKMSPEEMQETLMALHRRVMEERQKDLMEAASTNLEAAKKFLAENAKEKDVISLPSGLQYKLISAGKGEKPEATDQVKVHYTGKLLDGTVFDSSVTRGQPAVFPLNGVIPGWTEGLQLLAPGGKATLFIPPNLAYGEQGRPPVIPPNSCLVFDVELIEIVQ